MKKELLTILCIFVFSVFGFSQSFPKRIEVGGFVYVPCTKLEGRNVPKFGFLENDNSGLGKKYFKIYKLVSYPVPPSHIQINYRVYSRLKEYFEDKTDINFYMIFAKWDIKGMIKTFAWEEVRGVSRRYSDPDDINYLILGYKDLYYHEETTTYFEKQKKVWEELETAKVKVVY